MFSDGGLSSPDIWIVIAMNLTALISILLTFCFSVTFIPSPQETKSVQNIYPFSNNRNIIAGSQEEGILLFRQVKHNCQVAGRGVLVYHENNGTQSNMQK